MEEQLSILGKKATEIRVSLIKMCYRAQASHVGSGLSCADILTTLYIGKIINIDPTHPDSSSRDYFILSKGHAVAVLYATLAYAGFFEIDKLDSYYTNGSDFSGHPIRGNIPGIEASTGSLGHGLGLGCGLALALKLNNMGNRVFVLLSDGELNEGSFWESVLFAGAKKLSSIIAIIDYNKFQSFGKTDDVLTLEPIEDKFKAFNWEVRRINGNSIPALYGLLSLKDFLNIQKPKMIIADTIKGKGVKFMENKMEWHYKSPSKQQYEDAIKELR